MALTIAILGLAAMGIGLAGVVPWLSVPLAVLGLFVSYWYIVLWVTGRYGYGRGRVVAAVLGLVWSAGMLVVVGLVKPAAFTGRVDAQVLLNIAWVLLGHAVFLTATQVVKRIRSHGSVRPDVQGDYMVDTLLLFGVAATMGFGAFVLFTAGFHDVGIVSGAIAVTAYLIMLRLLKAFDAAPAAADGTDAG